MRGKIALITGANSALAWLLRLSSQKKRALAFRNRPSNRGQQQARAAGVFSEADAQTVARLDRRVVITARLTAALLLISTLAMAVARYA
jgi:hypothetical protein